MRQPRSSEAGMTLVEALMAVFIMGLASALIVLTLPNRDRPAVSETERLIELADNARTQAMISGQWIGLRLDDAGYAQVIYRDGRWTGAYAGRYDLPRGVSLERLQPLKRGEEERRTLPVMQFGPTGAAAGEALVLSAGSDERIITVSPSGAVLVEGDNG